MLHFSDHANIIHIKPFNVVHTGRPGRPRKVIDHRLLAEVLSSKRSINQSRLGRTIGVHRHTIRKYRRLYGIQFEYTDITDAELDILVKDYKMRHTESGFKYVKGYLTSRGLRIQKNRVLASMRRLDALGNALRERRSIRRRKYTTKRPNCLWHCDGHHKLIRWKIVIHGFIDGYCRTVCSFITDV